MHTTARGRTMVLAALAAGVVVLAALLTVTWLHVHRLRSTVTALQTSLSGVEKAVGGLRKAQEEAAASAPVSPSLLDFRLDLPGRGEVFPAMAAADAPEYWPVAVLTVSNAAKKPVAQVVETEILGWSHRTRQTVVVAPQESRQVAVQPELLPRAHANEEIRRATLEVKAAAVDGGVLFAESHPVLIHGGAEIYWGRRFANAQVAARWVTPHDRSVLELVSRARRFAPNGRLAGYASTGGAESVARQVRTEARAIYRALQSTGLSYVNSVFVMGDYVNSAQRIRLPRETLRLSSANCMDVSVVYASAAENIGLQPLLFIVPGHAFTGVRLGRGSERILYLDLTVMPKGSFEDAEARARSWLRRTPREKVLVVDVAAARALGLYPLSADQPPRAALGTTVPVPRFDSSPESSVVSSTGAAVSPSP